MRKELGEAMCAEREGADLGDTTVYLVSDIKENRQVVATWKGELKWFEQGMRLEHPQWEEDPERKGVRGYLGLWTKGCHPGEEGQSDPSNKEVSIKAELSSGEEKNSNRERIKN